MVSVSACPEDLYFTPNKGASAIFTNCANTTFAVVLGKPTFSDSGLALASATNFATPLTGKSTAEVLITIGSKPIIATESKSVAAW